jgi:hypothetical protein
MQQTLSAFRAARLVVAKRAIWLNSLRGGSTGPAVFMFAQRAT